MTKLTHEKIKAEALKNSGVKKSYNSLKDEFYLLEIKLKAQLEARKPNKK